MALKLNPAPTFWHPVNITVPGQPKPAVVDFEFNHKTKEQLQVFVEALPDDQRPDDQQLAELIHDWKGVDGEYTPSALRDLLSNYPASGLEILKGYLGALTESRKKN